MFFIINEINDNAGLEQAGQDFSRYAPKPVANMLKMPGGNYPAHPVTTILVNFRQQVWIKTAEQKKRIMLAICHLK